MLFSESLRGSWRRAPALPALCLGVSLIAAGLAGCEAERAAQSRLVPLPEPGTQPAPPEQTTAIAGNVAAASFGFDNFEQSIIQLDLSAHLEHSFNDYYVVKLFDEHKTYFLGSTPSLGAMTVHVLLPRGSGSVFLEVYAPSGILALEEIQL